MNATADDAGVREAVEAVRRGDHSAYARIVALYQRRLFGLALMITRDPSSAEEVAQDAFVRAFVHLGAYDAKRPFYPWLSTIAVRLAQNCIVARTRIAARETVGLSPADTHKDPLMELIVDENDRALWRSVSALPLGERTAVILHYRQEMSVAEIASALGVATGTVKAQLFRARQKLRITLDGVIAGGSK